MSNKKDLRFLRSQIAKVENTLSRVEKKAKERIEKISSDLQKLMRRSKLNFSKDEKSSKAIEKIFQIYKKAFKRADYKQYSISKDTLRYFNDLLNYTIMKEASQNLKGTLSPQAYLRSSDSKSINSLNDFLEDISVGGHIESIMEDKEKQKIDYLLKKVETSDEGHKVTNWQVMASLLKKELRSILDDKSIVPTMTVRRIGAKKPSKTSISTIDVLRRDAEKPLNSMSKKSLSGEDKHSISRKDDSSPRAIFKVSKVENIIPSRSVEK